MQQPLWHGKLAKKLGALVSFDQSYKKKLISGFAKAQQENLQTKYLISKRFLHLCFYVSTTPGKPLYSFPFQFKIWNPTLAVGKSWVAVVFPKDIYIWFIKYSIYLEYV